MSQELIMSNTQESTTAKIFRFKFDDFIINSIYGFAKLHQYDDRVAYKEAWSEWLECNDDLVERETRRLVELGYTGDVKQKMYKSGRYYYRTKSTQRNEPVKRREYVSLTHEFIDNIDQHINMHKDNENFKPSDGYDDFCKKYTYELLEEIKIIKTNGITESQEIANKIKKAYKNRCFQIINNQN